MPTRPDTPIRHLEAALIRDQSAAADLARDMPLDDLIPLLEKYARHSHPFETRSRVIECLETRDEWPAIDLLARFVTDATHGRDLRGQAASALATKDCSAVANDVLGALTEDLARLVEVAPVLMGIAKTPDPSWALALRGLRSDLRGLIALTEQALAQLDTDPQSDDER